ncbi:unnamed protein product, partial [Echinostoma caproni]|uniref:Cytochrome-b5 reductase n=1 Tax=Echinostoma caproni TaxID=27848 RepID=A0A183B214_9TREM
YGVGTKLDLKPVLYIYIYVYLYIGLAITFIICFWWFQVYKAGVNPNFPNGGKMSQFVMNIPIEQFIDVRGPGGNLHYKGRGVFDIKPDAASPPNEYKATYVSMICGGSGITPMFQLLTHILHDKKDCTKLALLYANNTEGDILLRDELEDLKDKFPDQFKLWYTVTEAPPRNSLHCISLYDDDACLITLCIDGFSVPHFIRQCTNRLVPHSVYRF